MDVYRLIIGIFGLGYGAVNLVAWATNRQKSKSALAMKTRWGEEKGRRWHGISYGILPFLVGVILLFVTLSQGA